MTTKLLHAYGVRSLLSHATHNPKNVYSVPLHLAPARLSGFNVCPMSTKGCRAACLHTAGNPLHMAVKSKARVARTRAFFEHRDMFMLQLIKEISQARRRARKVSMTLAVRLNATSDIRWETIPVYPGGKLNVFQLRTDVQVDDYTKIPNRKNIPPNYHLTFSLAENNDVFAREWLENNGNVAVVFDTKRTKPLPTRYSIAGASFTVIDGDKTDYRPRGVIVGLRAKGKDKSGFVRKSSFEETQLTAVRNAFLTS